MCVPAYLTQTWGLSWSWRPCTGLGCSIWSSVCPRDRMTAYPPQQCLLSGSRPPLSVQLGTRLQYNENQNYFNYKIQHTRLYDSSEVHVYWVYITCINSCIHHMYKLMYTWVLWRSLVYKWIKCFAFEFYGTETACTKGPVVSHPAAGALYN